MKQNAERKKQARCIKCKSVFEYAPVLTVRGRAIKRHVCDECRSGREKFLKKQWKRNVRAPLRNRGKDEPRATTTDGYVATLAEVGRRLGLDTSTVEMVQRQGLAKIRSSPELREAFQHYVEAGLPRIKELLDGSGRLRDRGERVLELQLQVGDFWQTYEELQRQSQKLDADPPPLRDLPLWRQRDRRAALTVQAELGQILQEINRVQQILRKELET